MSNMNLLLHLNGYDDSNSNNDPSLNAFRWNREYLGLTITDPISQSLNLASGETQTLFSGSVSLNADITTTYDIALKSGTSTTYIISHSGGTTPVFRTARTSGADATTVVDVTKNAKVITFTSSGGTLFSLISNGVVVGDRVRIGTFFNSLNQGEFKIIAVSATSFSIENETGVAESSITLGASYSEQVNIYSSSGVQVGDKIDIVDGFSLVTQGTYEIIDVSHDYIEFYSASTLPQESDVPNNPDAFVIYRSAKQFLYIEASQKLGLKINGSSITNYIEPFEVSAGILRPGIFFSKATIKSIEIVNSSTETCQVYYITAE